MKTYYLVGNMIYIITLVVQKRWWRRLLGEPRLTLGEVEAESYEDAKRQFVEAGHDMGGWR